MLKLGSRQRELSANTFGRAIGKVFFAAWRSLIMTPVFFYTRARLHRPARVLGLFFAALVLLTTVGLNLARPVQTAAASTSNTINFQARLESNTGAIVPDGNYDVEFKLHSTLSTAGGGQGSCTGDCLWMEDYTYNSGAGATDARVRVVDGYMTVNLASLTAFPNTINWDQQLWLTMNIGGTTSSGTITWDGEMSPRLQLTAVPYAFRAAQLAQLTGANESTLGFATQTTANSLLLPNESGTLCVQGSTNCSFAPTSGGANYIQNGTSPQTANFNITATGTIGSTLTVQGASALTLGTASTNSGAILFKSSGGVNTITLQSPTANPTSSYSLYLPVAAPSLNQCLANDNTTAGQLTFVTCVTSSNAFVQGGNSFGATASLGTNDANSLVFRTNGVTQATIAVGGGTIFQNSANSTSAFQVQNAAGDQMLNIDNATTFNLLTNPSVEQSITGNWALRGSATVTQDSTQQYYGNNSLKIVTTALASDGAEQAITLGNSTQYTLSFFGRLDSASAAFATLSAGYNNGTSDTACSALNSATLVTGGWTRITCTFTTPATHSGTPFVYIKQTDAVAHTWYVDALQLQTGGTASPFQNGLISLGGIVNSAVTFKTSTPSTNAFQIGNSAFVYDSVNNKYSFNGATCGTVTFCFNNDASIAGSWTVTQNIYSSGFISRAFTAGTGGVSANDVVTMQLVNGRVVDTATPRDPNVVGVANGTASVGIGVNVVISGITTVNADTGAVSIGDQLVTSSTAGQATVDNSATTGIIGYAMTAKAAGSSGSVTVNVRPVNGRSTVNFRPTTDSTTAFQVQNAGSTTTLLDVDTTNAKIGIGAAPSSTGSTLQVGGDISLTTLDTGDTATYLCRNSTNQIANCSPTASGSAFIQNGNAFGGQANLGTNDNFAVALRTNAVSRLIIDTSGNLTLQQTSTIGTSGVSSGSTHDLTVQPGVNSTASGSGAVLNLTGGDESGTTSATGGAVNIAGGQATGASGTRNGGTVTINGGASAAGHPNDGNVNIGTANTTGITLGNAANNTTLTLQGTGLTTLGGALAVQGGDLTFGGSSGRNIVGPTTGGLTIGVASGPLTLQTTTSGTLSVTSAGALNLTGAASSTFGFGSNSLAITSSNFTVTSGGVLDVLGASAGFQIGGSAATGSYLRGNGTSFVSGSIQSADIPVCTGSCHYISNQTTAQSAANFNIQSAATSSIGGVIAGASGQTADLFDLQDANGINLTKFSAAGAHTSYGVANSFTGLIAPTATSTGTAGNAFFYAVAAVNGSITTLPGPNVGLANNTSTINWGQVAGATGYKVYRSASSNFSAGANVTLVSTITNGATTTFTDSAVAGSAATLAAPSVVGLTVQSSTGQSSDTFDVKNIAGSVNFGVNSSGTPYSNNGLTISNGGLNVGGVQSSTVQAIFDNTVNGNPTASNLILKGNATQSAAQLILQDANGISGASFSATGNQLTLGTIAAAGTVYQGSLVLSDGTRDNFGATLNSSTLTASRTISLPDATGTICLQASTACGFETSTTTDFIRNQTTLQAASNFHISGTGTADTSLITPLLDTASAVTLNIGSTAANINLNQNTGIAANKTFTANGDVILQDATNSLTALKVINSTNTSSVLVADTQNTRVGIGGAPTATADTLQVTGSIRATTNITSLQDVIARNGNGLLGNVGPSSEAGLELGAGSYDARLYRSSAGSLTVQGFGTATGSNLSILGMSGQSADLFDVQTSTPSTVFKVGSTGASVFQNASNTTTALQVQNSSAADVLNVDTSSTSNLLPNGDFEGGGTTGWSAKSGATLTQTNSQQWQGNNSLSVATTITANDGAKYSGFTLVQNTQYTLSFYAKVGAGSISDLSIGHQNNTTNGEVDCLTGQSLNSLWKRFSCTFQDNTAINTNYLYIKKTGTAAETFYIDGVQLQAGATATAFNAGGALQIGGIVNSPLAIQNKQDSTNAVLVQNSGGTSSIFDIDTINGRVGIGTSAPAATLDLQGNEIVTSSNATGGIQLYGGGSATNATLALGHNTTSELQLGAVGTAGSFVTGTAAGDSVLKASAGSLWLNSATGSINLVATGSVTSNVPVVVTSPNASGAVQLYGGGATNSVNLTLGHNTTGEFQVGVAGAANAFLTGTSTSDAVINSSVGALWINTNTNINLSAGGNVTSSAPVVVTNNNATGGIQLYGGGATNSAVLAIGHNTASEYQLGVAGAANALLSGTALGDVVSKATNGAFWQSATGNINLRPGGSVTSNAPIVVTSSNATGGIQLYGGGAATDATLALGHNATSELQIGVVGTINDFLANTAVSDVVIKANPGAMWLSAVGNINLQSGNNITANAPIVVTNGSASGAVQVFGGSATNNGLITVGHNNASELQVAAVGSANALFTGTAAGDSVVNATGGSLWLRSSVGGITLQPAATGAVTIGSTAETGQITLGQSTASNTISIGAAAGNANTQVINIGTSSTTGSITNVFIGSGSGGETFLQSTLGVKINSLGTADNDNFLCKNTAAGIVATCNSTGNGAPFIQGGNSFAATAVLGTLDANGLQIVTGSAGPNGRAYFDTSNNLYLGNAGALGTAAAPNNFSILGTGSSTLGTAGGSVTLKGGNGTSATTGSDGGGLTLQGGDAGGTSPRNGGTLTLDSGAKTSTGTSTINLGTTNATTLNIGSSSDVTTIKSNASGILLQPAGGTTNPGVQIKPAADTTAAFQVQNAAGANILVVDSTNRQLKVMENGGSTNYALIYYDTASSTANYTASAGTVAVGTGAGAISVTAGSSAAITITANAASTWKTTAGTLTLQSGTSSDLILNPGSSIVTINGSSVVKLGSSAGDPATCTLGAIVYNSTTNLFRGCQGSTPAWATLSSTNQTLQNVYTASTGGTTPEIKVDSTRGGVDIQDADSSIGGILFAVRGSNAGGLGTSLLNVNSSNSTVNIGTSAASTALLVLGSDTDSTFNSGTATNAATEINGAMFYSSTDHNFMCGVAGAWITCNGLLYSNTAASTAVSTCLTTACGAFSLSAPIPASYCQAGRVIHIQAMGHYSVTGTPTLGMSVYYGTDGTTRGNDVKVGVDSPLPASASGATNQMWALDYTIICFSTTAMNGQGIYTFQNSTTSTTSMLSLNMLSTGNTTVTSTSTKNLYIFPQWSASSASNTATLDQLIVTGN